MFLCSFFDHLMRELTDHRMKSNFSRTKWISNFISRIVAVHPCFHYLLSILLFLNWIKKETTFSWSNIMRRKWIVCVRGHMNRKWWVFRMVINWHVFLDFFWKFPSRNSQIVLSPKTCVWVSLNFLRVHFLWLFLRSISLCFKFLYLIFQLFVFKFDPFGYLI